MFSDEDDDDEVRGDIIDKLIMAPSEEDEPQISTRKDKSKTKQCRDENDSVVSVKSGRRRGKVQASLDSQNIISSSRNSSSASASRSTRETEKEKKVVMSRAEDSIRTSKKVDIRDKRNRNERRSENCLDELNAAVENIRSNKVSPTCSQVKRRGRTRTKIIDRQRTDDKDHISSRSSSSESSIGRSRDNFRRKPGGRSTTHRTENITIDSESSGSEIFTGSDKGSKSLSGHNKIFLLESDQEMSYDGKNVSKTCVSSKVDSLHSLHLLPTVNLVKLSDSALYKDKPQAGDKRPSDQLDLNNQSSTEKHRRKDNLQPSASRLNSIPVNSVAPLTEIPKKTSSLNAKSNSLTKSVGGVMSYLFGERVAVECPSGFAINVRLEVEKKGEKETGSSEISETSNAKAATLPDCCQSKKDSNTYSPGDCPCIMDMSTTELAELLKAKLEKKRDISVGIRGRLLASVLEVIQGLEDYDPQV